MDKSSAAGSSYNLSRSGPNAGIRGKSLSEGSVMQSLPLHGTGNGSYRVDTLSNGFRWQGVQGPDTHYFLELGKVDLRQVDFFNSNIKRRFLDSCAQAFVQGQNGRSSSNEALMYWDDSAGGYVVDYQDGKGAVAVAANLTHSLQSGFQSMRTRPNGLRKTWPGSSSSKSAEKTRHSQSRRSNRSTRTGVTTTHASTRTRYGQGIGNAGATCWMNTTIALLNDADMRERLSFEEEQLGDEEASRGARLRNGIREQLRTIYAALDKPSQPLPASYTVELMRRLDELRQFSGDAGKGWSDPQTMQDLHEPFAYLAQAIGLEQIHRTEDALLDYDLTTLEYDLMQPLPAEHKLVGDLRQALLSIVTVQRRDELRVYGQPPPVYRQWREGFRIAAKALYDTSEKNHAQYDIDWEQNDQAKLMREALFFALHELGLFDEDANPLAGRRAQPTAQLHSIAIKPHGNSSLESLTQDSGLPRDLRQNHEDLPDHLYLHFDRGPLQDKILTPVYDLTDAVFLPDSSGKLQPYRVEKLVIHRGLHYYAYVRSPENANQWLEVNDGRVNAVPESQVLEDASTNCYIAKIKKLDS